MACSLRQGFQDDVTKATAERVATWDRRTQRPQNEAKPPAASIGVSPDGEAPGELAAGLSRKSNEGNLRMVLRGASGSFADRCVWRTRNLDVSFFFLCMPRAEDLRTLLTLCVSWNHRKRQRW